MSEIVHIAALGLCEHCGVLLNISNLPAEAMDADWVCPKCNKKTTGASFGYNKENVKVKWVGPGGVWVDAEPSDDFDLGNDLHVVLRMPRYW